MLSHVVSVPANPGSVPNVHLTVYLLTDHYNFSRTN